MSHQTGIIPNSELTSFMAKVRESKCRLFKVSIDKEQLSLSAKQDIKGDWKKDMEVFVPPLIEEKVPCYILFRLDNKEWLLLSYSPDNAPVRQKMLYASTKATMKKSFVIDSEYVASCKEDATLEGYEAHLKVEKAPPPMTMAERELAEIKLSENQCSVGVDHKQQTLKGLELPISDEAIDALFCLKEGTVNYVQLGIDIANESIVLHDKKTIDSGDDLKQTVPPGEPRYHLFNFRHIHDNQRVVSVIFIYTIPTTSCPVKVKMLYSSCKGPLMKDIEGKVEIPLARKLELDDLADLSEAFLLEQLYPKAVGEKQKFAKPTGPAGRSGGRRVIK